MCALISIFYLLDAQYLVKTKHKAAGFSQICFFLHEISTLPAQIRIASMFSRVTVTNSFRGLPVDCQHTFFLCLAKGSPSATGQWIQKWPNEVAKRAGTSAEKNQCFSGEMPAAWAEQRSLFDTQARWPRSRLLSLLVARSGGRTREGCLSHLGTTAVCEPCCSEVVVAGVKGNCSCSWCDFCTCCNAT